MSEPIFCMMVGLAGSGKSTLAEWRLEESKRSMHPQTIESSDIWREKLYNDVNDQTHNSEVFQAMQNSTVEKLKRGESVIYDATNLKIKDRKKILDLIKNIPCYKTCVIVATPVEVCIEQDAKRERSVGEQVIRRQLANFQIPFYEEGWDYILVLCNEHDMEYQDLIESMLGFEQQNKHHDFDLFTHCINSGWELLNGNWARYGYQDELLIATSLHDIGKLYTQTFSEDGQAHYFNHANVGAYHVLSHASLVALDTYTNDMILNICFYINYHMLPFDWKTDKAKDKWTKIFHKDYFDALMYIHECDKNSQHKKEI